MLPFSTLLESFPKLVRDLSRDCGKDAELRLLEARSKSIGEYWRK